ncbi:Diverse 7TM receptor extracellular region 2 [Hymenobacter roseosalivarius DSM 11622]|uniref:Diverse 7TM receptor extracellular region 2 n=1 Tax=Hymenobacter roseosalivarius DSM 11622 TaxID=645990 RepID=A0A1W1VXB8_9BACT|nr:7TM diverse intracellular signaling domain-containing protein [Hymenobacter roseosalivarius]SMB97890.1 Diverse 7TM receptor extracellular region 2 [Hymenobacter roseosalivarius DSM 11622]
MRALNLPSFSSGRFLLLWSCLLSLFAAVPAQAAAEDTLVMQPSGADFFIDGSYYSVLEDPSGRLTIHDVRRPDRASQFAPSTGAPNMSNTNSAYWLRFTVRNDDPSDTHWYLDLFDSHINDVRFFQPTATGYRQFHTGADLPFVTRPHPYKDFLFDLPLPLGQTQMYYLRLTSNSKTSFRAMMRNEPVLLTHFQAQYGLLGGFYGVLFIMVVYNLCIYLFIGEQTYLRYVLYVLSCSLLFLSEDGLGFEYVWSDLPGLNHLINAGAPVLLLFTFMHYARGFLDTALRVPRLDWWIRLVGALSVVLLLADIIVVRSGFSFWLYLLPYCLIYYAAVLVYQQGLRAARYLLLAHALVAVSLVFLITRKLGIEFLNNHFTVYSMNAAFVVEVTILSYALGEKIKGIKDARLAVQARLVKQLRKKHLAQDRLVEQLQQNQQLKDQLNSELEAQVARRTQELSQQSETIAAQNRELVRANGLLALQSAAIEKLNANLQHDLQQAQTARVLAKEVDFGEFSQIYPDKDACLSYLADLKWANGYQCRKCGYEKYCAGREPHARRCTRCRYVESATAYTMLQKCKFSIVKALYAVFLINAHQGNYSSQEMSRLLDLRQATCWSFSQKVMEAMRRRRQSLDYEINESWTHILLDATSETEEASESDFSASLSQKV